MSQKKLVAVLLLATLAVLLAGCGALAQRFAGANDTPGVTEDAEIQPEVSLEPGEGIGGGALEPADIGTAIQQTLDAALTEGAASEDSAPEATDTPVPPSATEPQPTSTSAASPTIPGAQFTQLYQTLTAIAASSTPTSTEEVGPADESTDSPANDASSTPLTTPSSGASPTATPNLTQQAIAARPCLALRFIADVTIPDGTPVQPSSTFFKSWYVQNVGSCRWKPEFKLIFHSGAALGARSEYELGTFVNPDQYVTLSAQMQAPATGGYYTSFWGLADENGLFFGWSADDGQTFDQPFYVLIYVLGSSSGALGPGIGQPGVVSTAPPYTPVP
ncbi:MAG: hypothetical protein HYZ26_02800 [Chloroflexi bacterium]|nr:hypothetical protein [Chloroflexota bacterium]